MRVLVTGGTGMVGRALVDALIAGGHEVRVLARRVRRKDIPTRDDLDHWVGDVTHPHSLRGAASDCDGVIHLAAAATKERSSPLHQRVNAEGTRNLLAEAEHAGASRFVLLSCLGAEAGRTSYLASKRGAEELVRHSPLEWTILRSAEIYAPEGGPIAMMLSVLRALPVIPAVGRLDTALQPVWVGDVATALVRIVSSATQLRMTAEIAGPETTNQRDLLRRLSGIVHRKARLAPVPPALVPTATRTLVALGVAPPMSMDHGLQLRREPATLAPYRNALGALLGAAPTALDDGLSLLSQSTAEQLPSHGNGDVKRRRFWIDISGCHLTPSQVIQLVRDEFASLAPRGLMKVGLEKTSAVSLGDGATVTIALPVRGHVQVRVEEVTEHSVTCATLAGHPLSGVVRFLAEQRGEHVRFEVQTIDRPSTRLDRFFMAVVGAQLKHLTWRALVRRVQRRVGGSAPQGVQQTIETLDSRQAVQVDRWIRKLVERRIDETAEVVSG